VSAGSYKCIGRARDREGRSLASQAVFERGPEDIGDDGEGGVGDDLGVQPRALAKDGDDEADDSSAELARLECDRAPPPRVSAAVASEAGPLLPVPPKKRRRGLVRKVAASMRAPSRCSVSAVVLT
jgi:hypothetical protein